MSDWANTRPCNRCGSESDGRGWIVESEHFYLCGDCNPKLHRLIRDWLKLGWTDIPAKENIA